MTIIAISAVVVLAIVVAVLTIWLVPTSQVDRWRRAGINEEKLAELSVNARTSIAQAFGGLALVATLAITAYQVTETRRSSDKTLRVAERGQLAERYAQAVKELGANDPTDNHAIDARMGRCSRYGRSAAIRTIFRRTSRKSAFFTVAAWVRNNYVRPGPLNKHGCNVEFRPARSDVDTALRFVTSAARHARISAVLICPV